MAKLPAQILLFKAPQHIFTDSSESTQAALRKATTLGGRNNGGTDVSYVAGCVRMMSSLRPVAREANIRVTSNVRPGIPARLSAADCKVIICATGTDGTDGMDGRDRWDRWDR